MTGDRDGRMSVEIQSLALEGTLRGHLGQQDAGTRDRGGREVLDGGQRLVGGQRADPLHRFEADRAHHHQFPRQRLEQQLGLGDQLADLGLDPCRVHQLLEVLQPGAALAAERDRVRLTGVQSIDEGVRP